jgi:N4-(beta-N-acetylglucosaminyl)-L-asparaginase
MPEFMRPFRMANVNRREFMAGTAGAGLAAAARPQAAGGPTVLVQGPSRPVVIASGNGHRFRNGGTQTCVETAFERLTRGDDLLEALLAGVTIVERDPLEDSVGYGGLPNAEGVVQLDACCMHGPRKRAGGVGALEGVKTPSLVAQAVMDRTDHHLLVGAGAQQFARMLGFEILPDLNTPNSRGKYLEWKQRVDPLHYIKDADARAAAERRVVRQMVAEGLIGEEHLHGTINCNGLNARGDVCGVTTTSGLAWKIPGRLGDSPVLGAGLYVDNEVGAAGSTGRGEANLYGLCSFLIVDEMRRGAHPKDAGLTALKRVQASTVEKRLLNSRGLPNFGLTFYVLNKRGDYAGVAMYGGAQFAVCDERGPRLEPVEPLLQGQAGD